MPRRRGNAKHSMQMTFRWYGASDPVRLEAIRQIPGVTGVVSALYDVPAGAVWTRDALAQLQDEDRFAEALFTGLRLVDGVDCAGIAGKFGVDPWIRFGAQLTPYVEAGLVWRRGSRISPCAPSA